ncbi:maltooligosyl trehalose synthase [Faunimonas pinastri]|uniref:Maltooligosyl trehalose synthase n=1 Tax=Faunimonas pinastri TaxID=1855383 RepID=A0A1H9LWM3_9HYPH|nr:malto-oligosyltrehalose synthase [Faunimonas pinastri]SER15820.1 maltooligosyl trehalose synthase [Faunimonas pinastri]
MAQPTATYRLQFRGNMDLGEAAGLAPYFRKLGVSHFYASPIFTATPGSTHGYDVSDFNEVEPELGGKPGFDALSEALRAQDIGMILDFVPNHMGASVYNPWWRSVLEWGQASDYADHFDIDWSAPKLVIPVLGQPYGEALSSDMFGLIFDSEEGSISFAYFENRLPLNPTTYARILGRIETEPFPELARRFAIARPESVEPLKTELASLAGNPEHQEQLDRALADTLGDRNALHEIHEAQAWRLTYWRAAREGLTYRRFFEIADLVGVKVERPRVFDDVHRLLLEMIAAGQVQGVRLDHIDGLADPKAYLNKLQEAIGSEDPFYLVVEKILGPDETVRQNWPIAGTTGYEFMQALVAIFVDPAGEAPMDEAYQAFLGQPSDYKAMVQTTKRSILARNLAGELEVLKEMAHRLSERDPYTRDVGSDSLRRAILEIAAALPVYRTYVNIEGVQPEDIELIDGAVEAARLARQVDDEGALAFISKMMKLDFPNPEDQATALEFAARFQQTTGPVMAKALEDTVFYRYNRLVALNEVGGEPDRFGATPAAFHAAMHDRLKEQPFGLSATSTHDTKRGEDGRARLYTISEIPALWREAVGRWSDMNGSFRTELEDGVAPEPELEWLFYQAMAGAWPAGMAASDKAGTDELKERMSAYMIKVVREAKARTSWTAPVEDYENAVKHFVGCAFEADRGFLPNFAATIEPICTAGAVVSFAQLAVKLMAPGVPDIYQGTELWDLSLVDPDNRRPVDFALRRRMLDGIAERSPEDLIADWKAGSPKMRILSAGLDLRQRHSELFGEGEYLPLEVTGARAGHIVAFARRRGSEAVIVIAPRLPMALMEGVDLPLIPAEDWGDTRVVLPDGIETGQLTDAIFNRDVAGDLRVSEILRDFPVALIRSGG